MRDPDLFRIKNELIHDMCTKRLGINPLVKRCGFNPALRSLLLPIMMSKIKSRSGINPSLHHNFLDVSIISTGLNMMEANKPEDGQLIYRHHRKKNSDTDTNNFVQIRRFKVENQDDVHVWMV
jgi:hypothetical protein